ncbi:hypothetical protein FO440_08350 [Mucilaginibacter corticis]|uniref:LiaI-LiaF-like transmembrane region domain-containing protein n=1 Tax=Mucilaginibacter corticis TaxID=2597670 RepID=A0A556MWI4_9SPHI|nr:DUF5668 domain-containing protein [Mucilaginibacter corticis]TSJ44169.1 hypothetical protein FO440_08350 [Mucilaginibacter corticis]
MKNDKIIPGLVLILIGAVILLHNYGVIPFHWGNLFYLWPIFIVVAGINLIFAHNRSNSATALKIAVIVGGFCLIIFGNFDKKEHFWNKYNNNFNDNSDDDDNDDDNDSLSVTKVEGNSQFNTPFAANTKVARLSISGGGTTYTLSDTTNQLFTANTHEFKGKYEFTHNQKDSVADLNFSMKGRHGISFDFDDNDKDSSKSNSAVFKLNTAPEWDINIKTGATKLDFDLAKFKIRSLSLSGGAADFDVKLGQPLAATNVDVETGMSAVTIRIPANAACHIKSSTGLSSTNFEGFVKQDDGTYETAGFSSAKNKIYIKMSGGMADFKVKRY